MRKLIIFLLLFLISQVCLGDQITFYLTNGLIDIFSFSDSLNGNLYYDPYKSKITVKFGTNILEFFENREFFILNSNFVLPMIGGLVKSNNDYYLRISSVDNIVSFLRIECRIINYSHEKNNLTDSIDINPKKYESSTNFTQTYNTNNAKNDFVPITFVIIDPGHGGKDPGAIHNSLKEKDLTLKYGKKIASELSQKLSKSGIKVILTRNDDIYLTLEQRAKIAIDLINRAKGYGFFISIHMNASPIKTKKGMEIYYVSEQAVDDNSREVLAFENSFIPKEEIKKVSELEKVISKIRSIALMEESKILSKIISKKFDNNPIVKGAPFYVIKYIPIPSILLEVGYISNPEESKTINSDLYIDLFAKKLAEGILDFITEYNRTKGFTLGIPSLNLD
ncbi:MAG: N-acetylmuramoyl-L-alanine amidase [Brevinematia bacterium]